MKLTAKTPLDWREGWSLHRRAEATDSHGDIKNVYDMNSPDFIGKAGASSGVAWHILNHEAALKEYGPGVTAAASFLLDFDLEIGLFDRCVFGGAIWEVRSVLERSAFRTVKLVEVERVGDPD